LLILRCNNRIDAFYGYAFYGYAFYNNNVV
jgi:hypothetical protein